MKLTASFHALMLSGGFVYASSLAVYQDNTFYNFTPKNNFIGFTKNVEAKCKGRSIPLLVNTSCPSDERLCQLLEKWQKTEQELETVKVNTQVLEKLISLPQPTTFDADNFIENAKRLSVEQARLSTLHRSLTDEAEIIEGEFQKQAVSRYALQTSQVCDQEIELTIPQGYVSFSTHYEADITDEKKAAITQYLSVTNRSGIDIQADTAMFFYRSSQQYLYPIHFRPWIVSKYEPRPEYTKSNLAKRKSMDIMAESARMAPAVAMSTPVATYEDAREYKIEGLFLPSTDVPVDVKVVSWRSEFDCGIRAYPYENTDAFYVCSFEPKYQIDSNNWKVRSSGVLINENTVGEYREGQYDLYTKIEEDIKIERKRIVNKERETGIFGGTVRKKDGFTLTLINKSDKAKDVTLIERIPTSTTEEITSKLLNINSEKKINYAMHEDGQIEMNLTLVPHEHKKIDVLFEISHDKDLKVNY